MPTSAFERSKVSVPGVKLREKRLVSPLKFQRAITALEVCLDFGANGVAVLAAYCACGPIQFGKRLRYPTREALFLAVIFGLLVVFLLERESAYRGGNSLLRIRETERALKVPCVALLLLIPINWLAGNVLSREMLALLTAALPLVLMIEKAALGALVQTLLARGHGTRNAVIYGAGPAGRRLFSTLLNSPKIGYKPVAIFDHPGVVHERSVFPLAYHRSHSVAICQDPVTATLLRSLECDTLFVAIPDVDHAFVFQLVQVAKVARCEVAFLPDRRYLNAHSNNWMDLDGLLLTFAERRLDSRTYVTLKRALDVLVAGLLLLVFSPVLALLATLICWETPGGAFFRQDRVGLNGIIFSMLKFRTMYRDTPAYAVSPVRSHDARVTKLGRVLRKTSLDELPQLVNVLLGEMSLVGPRPEMPLLVQDYGPIERQRLSVMPGITGLWQISADRAFLIHESPEYDPYYIRNRGFFLDFAILIHTALFAMRGI